MYTYIYYRDIILSSYDYIFSKVYDYIRDRSTIIIHIIHELDSIYVLSSYTQLIELDTLLLQDLLRGLSPVPLLRHRQLRGTRRLRLRTNIMRTRTHVRAHTQECARASTSRVNTHYCTLKTNHYKRNVAF